jgi:hypothetical protein
VTFTFTSSLNSLLLSLLLCYFLAVNVYHFIPFILLSNFRSPLLRYTLFFQWVWSCPQHRSKRSAKIGRTVTLLLRARQTLQLPAKVSLAYLSTTFQSTAYKSNIVTLVCNFVLIDKQPGGKRGRHNIALDTTDRQTDRQTEGYNVQHGLLTLSITTANCKHEGSVPAFTLSTRNTFTNSSCNSSLYTPSLLLVGA